MPIQFGNPSHVGVYSIANRTAEAPLIAGGIVAPQRMATWCQQQKYTPLLSEQSSHVLSFVDHAPTTNDMRSSPADDRTDAKEMVPKRASGTRFGLATRDSCQSQMLRRKHGGHRARRSEDCPSYPPGDLIYVNCLSIEENSGGRRANFAVCCRRRNVATG